MAWWSNDKANKRGRWGEAAAGLSRALFPLTLFQVVLVMFACCVWHKNNHLRRTCFLSSQWVSFRDECLIVSDWFDELGSIKITEYQRIRFSALSVWLRPHPPPPLIKTCRKVLPLLPLWHRSVYLSDTFLDQEWTLMVSFFAAQVKAPTQHIWEHFGEITANVCLVLYGTLLE